MGELVEHRLHSPVIQADAVVDDRLVAKSLEHAVQCLACAGNGRAGDLVGHQSQRLDALAHGLRLFQTFVGELALRVALVAERLGLGVPHDDEDTVVFLRCFGDFTQLDAHPWLPSRTVCPVWRCGGVVLLPV